MSPTADSPAQRAVKASSVSLLVALVCLAQFLPPLLEATLTSVLRAVATALALATALLLHWVFLVMAASRLQRSVLRWGAMGVLLFPIGGAAALMLLSFLEEERSLQPQGL